MQSSYSNLVAGFTKLFSTIIHSTVWREDMHVKVVWVTMLAMANRNGQVYASIPGLADASKVTLEQCLDALQHLSSPDEYSRTKTFDGRRIAECDGGWQLLNYQKYREMRDADERRIQGREAVKRFRRRKKSKTITVSNVSRGKPRKAQAEAEAEAEAEKERERTRAHETNTFSVRAGDFCEWYGLTHERLLQSAYIGNPHKDYDAALLLARKLTDQEMRDAALVWFGMDDAFATSGTRTIPKFASRATACLQRIKERGLA